MAGASRAARSTDRDSHGRWLWRLVRLRFWERVEFMCPLSEGTITQTLELLHSGSADARGTVTYQGNFALRCAPKHIAREAGGFLSTTEAAI